MDPEPTGRVHCYSRDVMLSIRDVSEASQRRPAEFSIEFNNEEGLFSPDAWIEHCWIREGVADRAMTSLLESVKKKPLLGEVLGRDHQRKGFFDDDVVATTASAHGKLRSHKYSTNGMDFRPSFQKTSTTPGQSLDVYRPWMRNMDHTSTGVHRHMERNESVPEWLDGGPESITDVIELHGFDDSRGANVQSHRREQKPATAAPIPLTMPKTDEEFAALLGLTFDDLKLDAPTSEAKSSNSESNAPAQSRFSKFFATNTQPTSAIVDGNGAGREEMEKGIGSPPGDADQTVTPATHSLLQKLFGGQLGGASKINSDVSPVRRGVMSAEELERQLMMEAQVKKEDSSAMGVKSGGESINRESERVASMPGDDAGSVEASRPHAPSPSSSLPPTAHPLGHLFNPMALEAFLQQYFPTQDRLLRMHSATPLDLYQRRLTFIHIMSRQWTMGVPAGGPPAFPPFPSPHLSANNNPIDMAQRTTDYGLNAGGDMATAPPMLQKLLSQSGSRSESHAGSPLPTSAVGVAATGVPVAGKKVVMSVEELERSFLESSSSSKAPPETRQSPIPPPPTAPLLGQIGPPLMAGFPPPMRLPVFPAAHPNVPAVPSHAQMHAYHQFLMAQQQTQLLQQRQQHMAMTNAPTAASFSTPPPSVTHLQPAPPAAIHHLTTSNNTTTSPQTPSSKWTTPTAQTSADETGRQADGPKPAMSSAAFMPTSVLRKQASRKQSDGPKSEV